MALDANFHEMDSESGYMQYIATRPRVQKHGGHGLFSSATAGIVLYIIGIGLLFSFMLETPF